MGTERCDSAGEEAKVLECARLFGTFRFGRGGNTEKRRSTAALQNLSGKSTPIPELNLGSLATIFSIAAVDSLRAFETFLALLPGQIRMIK